MKRKGMYRDGRLVKWMVTRHCSVIIDGHLYPLNSTIVTKSKYEELYTMS